MKEWERGYWAGSLMGIVASVVGVVVFALASKPACAQVQNWETSPQNWRNSQQNWDNSSQNWNNNPQNWKNSSNNYNATNGVYSNSGDRLGYETMSPSGVKNYYDNDGNRKGYNSYGR